MRPRSAPLRGIEPTAGGSEPRRVGWVLGGGGARGAYEVGVCDYIFTQIARDLGQPLPLDVVSGTSVGALHACALAAGADDPLIRTLRCAAQVAGPARR